MTIVVIGASGRIGEKLVYNLRQEDCMVFEASLSFGVDAITGAGLARALRGVEIVIDVSPSNAVRDGAADDAIELATYLEVQVHLLPG
jgi:dihydrodipicolinate reductase